MKPVEKKGGLQRAIGKITKLFKEVLEHFTDSSNDILLNTFKKYEVLVRLVDRHDYL